MKEETNKNTVHISSSSFFKCILIILLVWFLFFIKDIVLVVLTAVVIASGMEPIIHWFKKFKITRLPAAIISYVGLIGILSALMFFFLPAVLDETSSFLTTLPRYLDSATLWNPLNITSSDVVEPTKVVQGISEGISNPQQLVRDSLSQVKAPDTTKTNFGVGDLINSIQDITSNVSDGYVKIISAIFGGILSFMLIVVLSFYLLVQDDGVGKFLGLIAPIKHEKYIVDLWKRSQRKIGQWMQGQLLLGVLVGVLLYLGFVILGVRNALLLAILSGVLEIIPVFGPIIASIPAILMAFTDGGVTAALLVAGLYVIVQQFESNLIYPLVVKKIIGVSPIIVILALIIGAKLAGFLGVVLSVPLVSALMEFVEDLERKKTLFWKQAEGIETI